MSNSTLTSSQLDEFSRIAKEVYKELQSKYVSENNIQKNVSDLINEISKELKVVNKH